MCEETLNFEQLALDIKHWAHELGFQQAGITDTSVLEADDRLQDWLAKKFNGSMHYLEKNADKRRYPDQLHPNTLRIIAVRLNYLPQNPQLEKTLKQSHKAYISRYALGRDYHKVIRQKLNQLAKKINAVLGEFSYRAFADSAPIHERELAFKAGLGWFGKNTMMMNRTDGSWFFLGELFTDVPLPIDNIQQENHCGSCTSCMDVCPTNAIIAPYQLDARRCISYLTIENKGSIPVAFRKAMGNRIYGCDDCQIFCPWNKFAKTHTEKDFTPRHNLMNTDLVELFLWDEKTFLQKTEGSAMRRVGYEAWLRNIAVALGNAEKTPDILSALQKRQDHESELVREHVKWALEQS